MKNVIISSVVILLALNSCYGQTEKKKTDQENDKNVPGKNIVVNKEYDENGNLIRYDSTYTYSYSDKGAGNNISDSVTIGTGKNFDLRDFFGEIPFFGDNLIDEMFPSDSLHNGKSYRDEFFEKKFFNDRFFNDRFFGDSLYSDMPHSGNLSRDQLIKHIEQMEKRFRSLDSLNYGYFRKQFNMPLTPGEKDESNSRPGVF